MYKKSYAKSLHYRLWKFGYLDIVRSKVTVNFVLILRK